MSSDRRNIDELLLDWHLDRLEPGEREWLEKTLGLDDGLRARSDRVRQVLQPLDAWQVPPAARLADKVVAFVNTTTARPESAGAVPSMPPPSDPTPRLFPFLRAREFLAVAACLVVLVGISLPGGMALRSQARRAVCADNLGTIYRGLSAYRADFAGALPHAGAAGSQAWLPTANTSAASNSRHPFLLAKLGFVPNLSAFVCGDAVEADPVAPATLASYTDFPTPSHIGYDTLNLAGASPNLRPPPGVAYMGDRNPLFLQGRFHDELDPDRTNSPAHRGKGQTVLTLGGAAEFVRTPIFGQARDNLWLADGIRKYTGTETPTRPDDSFLVPGFSTRR